LGLDFPDMAADRYILLRAKNYLFEGGKILQVAFDHAFFAARISGEPDFGRMFSADNPANGASDFEKFNIKGFICVTAIGFKRAV